MLWLAGLLSMLAVGAATIGSGGDLVADDSGTDDGSGADSLAPDEAGTGGSQPSDNQNLVLAGTTDADQLTGEGSADALSGDDGKEGVHDGLDDETPAGGRGEDTRLGGWGDEVISGRDETDSNSDDHLNGGGGNNALVAGESDVIGADVGEDAFYLGDWLAGSAAEIVDFDSTEDTLLLVWDMNDDPDPDVEVVADDEADGVSHILVNGQAVAAVQGETPPETSDIVLVDSGLVSCGQAAA